jgi:hypothetical protein
MPTTVGPAARRVAAAPASILPATVARPAPCATGGACLAMTRPTAGAATWCVGRARCARVSTANVSASPCSSNATACAPSPKSTPTTAAVAATGAGASVRRARMASAGAERALFRATTSAWCWPMTGTTAEPAGARAPVASCATAGSACPRALLQTSAAVGPASTWPVTPPIAEAVATRVRAMSSVWVGCASALEASGHAMACVETFRATETTAAPVAGRAARGFSVSPAAASVQSGKAAATASAETCRVTAPIVAAAATCAGAPRRVSGVRRVNALATWA